MSIAAVIPTYNAAAFLEGTLASVFAQTLTPDEVIVVDDASTDDTVAIAKRLGAAVIVMPRNSGGPAMPLNAGIASAKSEWIATLDHDDRWRPDWLATAMQAIRDLQVEFVFGRVNVSPSNPGMQMAIDEMYDGLRDFAEASDAHAVPIVADSRCFRMPRDVANMHLIRQGSIAVTCSSMVFSRRIGLEVGFDPAVQRCCDYRITQQVVTREDIGYVDAISCDWVSSPNSLYQQQCNMDALDRELMYVYKQFRAFDPVTRVKIRHRCRKTANDLAYAARNRGEYRRAFADYHDSLRYGGVNRTALLGMLKLPLAMLRGVRS